MIVGLATILTASSDRVEIVVNSVGCLHHSATLMALHITESDLLGLDQQLVSLSSPLSRSHWDSRLDENATDSSIGDSMMAAKSSEPRATWQIAVINLTVLVVYLLLQVLWWRVKLLLWLLLLIGKD